MWTRIELKDRAKNCLKRYYWYAFLACLIAGFLGGGSSSGGASFSGSINNNYSTSGGTGSLYNTYASFTETMGIMLIVLAVFLIIAAVVIIFSAFVSSPVQVGLKRYFLESRVLGKSAGIDKLFYAFSCGSYRNIVKIMFLKGLYTFFWSLLLVIPGIIKGYEYSMIPYILAENPDIEASEAFRLTKAMTDGEKLNIFVLRLSFIGWYLLGVLACCIGGIFVTPYEEATFAELYTTLKNCASGFPFKGFGGEPELKNPYYDGGYGQPYGGGGYTNPQNGQDDQGPIDI